MGETAKFSTKGTGTLCTPANRASACACAAPWTPEPKIAAVRAPGRASARTASMVVAAVRKRVIAFASSVARQAPSDARNNTITKLNWPRRVV